jgi:hypothetical protein
LGLYSYCMGHCVTENRRWPFVMKSFNIYSVIGLNDVKINVYSIFASYISKPITLLL